MAKFIQKIEAVMLAHLLSGENIRFMEKGIYWIYKKESPLSHSKINILPKKIFINVKRIYEKEVEEVFKEYSDMVINKGGGMFYSGFRIEVKNQTQLFKIVSELDLIFERIIKLKEMGEENI